MKKLVFLFSFIFTLVFIFNQVSAKDDFPVLKGPYLGQKPPGMTPEIFAPGIVSTGFDELFGCFTQDGKEFYYILGGPPVWTIMVMKQKNGIWSKPQIASFSGQYIEKFCLSPDGNKIVLTSLRPIKDGEKRSKEYNTWILKRTPTGWSQPKLIRILAGAFAPSMAANGNLYFFMGAQGSQDLYISKFIDGKYQNPINLGDRVNSDQPESDPFVAPDESYLIFCSNRREGKGLYICYKTKNHTWTEAKNMGSIIKSFGGCNPSSVSPDGKYFFFFSNHFKYDFMRDQPISYEEKIQILKKPGNGSLDIYWVDAKIIEDLKPKNLK